MTKLLYCVLLAVLAWETYAYQDDEYKNVIPHLAQENREIKCGRWYAQFPNEGDCTSYIVCQNGQKSIKQCDAGEHYNMWTLRCEEPCKAMCDKSLSCECKWATCGLDDVCFEEQVIGGCRGNHKRFFFNKRNGKCEEFVYSGCRGNENNFRTMQACEDRCTNTLPDLCNLPPETGYCRAKLINYYYNSTTGQCEEFTYGGCGGNENNFDRLEECEDTCKKGNKDKPKPNFVCLAKDWNFPNPSDCGSYFKCSNWEPESVKCAAGLHFSDKEQACVAPCEAYCDKSLSCQCQWPTCNLPELCFMANETGPCRALHRNFYFNRRSGECEEFIYGGCAGNENNFWSIEECQKACPKTLDDRCLLPPETGPCRGNYRNYYFDRRTGKCERFVYGGCNGNKNNFWSLAECEKTCPKSLPDLCVLPPETGYCRAKFRNWHFNHKTGQCEIFTYGGCGGNENNFQKQEECEAACAKNAPVPKYAEQTTEEPNDETDWPTEEKQDAYVSKYFEQTSEEPTKPPIDALSDWQTEETRETPSTDEDICAEDGRRSDLEHCDRYINCSGGHGEIVYCPKGLHYNEATKECDSPCDAHCDVSLAMVCGWQMYSECRENEHYNDSSACQPNCTTLNKPYPCNMIVIPGCVCDEGYVRESSPDGRCIPVLNCPRAENQAATASKCGKNERFDFILAGCQQDCSNYNDPFFYLHCRSVRQGCICKSGFVRDSNGMCILTKDCPSTIETSEGKSI